MASEVGKNVLTSYCVTDVPVVGVKNVSRAVHIN